MRTLPKGAATLAVVFAGLAMVGFAMVDDKNDVSDGKAFKGGANGPHVKACVGEIRDCVVELTLKSLKKPGQELGPKDATPHPDPEKSGVVWGSDDYCFSDNYCVRVADGKLQYRKKDWPEDDWLCMRLDESTLDPSQMEILELAALTSPKVNASPKP